MNILKIALILLVPLSSVAQQIAEGGVFLGFSNYQGDLTKNQISLGETKLAYGGFFRYGPHNKFKIRGNLYIGNISGDDKNAGETNLKNRNWRFEAQVIEVSLIGEFHPFGRSRTGSTGIFRRQVSPYVATGLGLAYAGTSLHVPEKDLPLFPEQSDTDNFLCVPFIAGVRADLHEHFSFGFEWGWRATFNDYLDNVSQNGNPDKNDWYLFIGGSVTYFFGSLEPFNFQNK